MSARTTTDPEDHPRSGRRATGFGSRSLILEALRRSEAYLTDLRCDDNGVRLPGGNRRMAARSTAIRAAMARRGTRSVSVDRMAHDTQTSTGSRGFLAGIYDAEGGLTRRACGSRTRIRRSSTGSPVACADFDFRYVVRARQHGERADDGARHWRSEGAACGSSTTTGPRHQRANVQSKEQRSSATRRWALRRSSRLGWSLPLYDITTGTGDFIANGVVSHNCFARPTHTYLDLNADRDFEREIVVKVNVPEVARAELSRPSWKREHVALGTNTDPYQWVESRYKLMPGIWEALLDTDTPCSLVTKSPLALRDIDILTRARRRARRVGLLLGAHARREGLARDRAPHPLPAGATRGRTQDERGRRAVRASWSRR